VKATQKGQYLSLGWETAHWTETVTLQMKDRTAAARLRLADRRLHPPATSRWQTSAERRAWRYRNAMGIKKAPSGAIWGSLRSSNEFEREPSANSAPGLARSKRPGAVSRPGFAFDRLQPVTDATGRMQQTETPTAGLTPDRRIIHQFVFRE
jgi:hypothetical protein